MAQLRQATRIGWGEDHTSRRWFAACAAIVTVGLDLLVVASGRLWGDQGWYVIIDDLRGAISLTGLVALACLFSDSGRSLGLKASPVQGWRAWLRVTGWLAVALAVVGGLVILALFVVGGPLPPYAATPPSRLPASILVACFVAPVLEEVTYRVVLCAGLVGVLGELWTIIVSGVVFAILHWLYGNPSLENQVAGFLLAWVYLRSGTVILPIALHSLGNAVVVATHVVGWQMGS